MASSDGYANLVVVESAVILRLLRDPAAIAEFPFIATAAAKMKAVPKKKGSCGKCPSKITGVDFALLKATIANLPVEDIVKLKRRLQAKQLRIVYTLANGKPSRKTV